MWQRLLIVALALACAAPAIAGPRRHRPRAICVPVYIEGAGTVRICAPAHRG